MKKAFIIGFASVVAITFSSGAFASQVGTSLKGSFKTYEASKSSRSTEIKEVLTKKTQFDSLQTATARRITKNISDLNMINSTRTSANSLKEFALRGTNEIDAIEALVQADKVVRELENSSGLKAEDRAEIESLKTTIKVQSELMSQLGENPIVNGQNAKANEALSNLISILPRLTTEFKAEEREGYNKLMKDVIRQIKTGEIPADALRKALNDDAKLEQLKGCKA